jgi:hypothetical protein
MPLEARQLVGQLTKAREKTVPAGRHKFSIRRPTELDLLKRRDGDNVVVSIEMVRDYVVGWEGVRESDIVGAGGSDEIVPFSSELCRAWLEDRADLWPALLGEMQKLIVEHDKALQDASKNS